jgi:predicted component of type VI protein secretion system
MREERLIERIRSWNKAPDRRDGSDPKRMVGSIIRHLERILNTRRGSAQIFRADDPKYDSKIRTPLKGGTRQVYFPG